MIEVLASFAPVFLGGFLLNLEIAGGAMLIGLSLGGILALVIVNVGWLRAPASILIQLLLCLPGYIVMFFLVNLLGSSGMFAVILAQSVFATAYCSEMTKHVLEDLKIGDLRRATLFIPNAIRGFTITTMSSGLAAAVGIPESVGLTMHEAGHLPALRDRIILFLCVIGFFAVFFGLVKAASARISAWLLTSRLLTRRLVPEHPVATVSAQK
jgi:ABC-type amino acid transport system permease subunit